MTQPKIKLNLSLKKPLEDKIEQSDPKIYLCFDTETTGLHRKWAKIIQIAWILFDQDYNIISKQEYLINHHDINPNRILDTQHIHGISYERILHYGLDVFSVLKHFYQDFKKSEIVLGHNIDFDMAMVTNHGLKYGFQFSNLMDKRELICTLKMGHQFIKTIKVEDLPEYCFNKKGKVKNKVKLEELYQLLSGNQMENAHQALVDVQHTCEVFHWIQRYLNDGPDQYPTRLEAKFIQ